MIEHTIVSCGVFEGLFVVGVWMSLVLTVDLAIRIADRIKEKDNRERER